MESSEESPAQRQARLRRERRQAKINSQGASRLEAITSLSGRPAPAPEEPTSNSSPKTTAAPPSISASSTSTSTTVGGATATPTSSSAETDDPPEIDISQHYYAPSRPARSLTPSTPASGQLTPGTPDNGGNNPNDDPMMQMMQQMLRGGGPPGMDGASGPGGAPEGEDPMLKMLQQMMGGGGGMPGMPGMPGAPGASQQEESSSNAAYVWRIVHALMSFSLAIYIALGSAFDGTKVTREHGQSSFDGVVEIGGVNIGQRLFWMFATVEVVLQSTRFFVEKGRLQQGGLMGTLSTILPEPYAGYVRMAGRYSVIYTTVVADAMVVVFVLGAVAWWKGLVAN